MKNLSEVDIHEFLSRCNSRFVEGRTMQYEGETYAIPYSTVTVQGVKIKGLRENESRIKLLENLMDEHSEGRKSYLDIGCNLGVFVKHFSDKFDNVTGIDAEPYYNEQAKFLFSDIKDSYILNNLNSKPLSRLSLLPMDVITCLSMIEYISDKTQFVGDMYNLTNELCIVEGHSEDIKLGLDRDYENLLREKDWEVTRLEETTDVGINAPEHTQKDGRPLWICRKK
jgi:SAM-dependent methyltransferase